jgi:hypothetical protein
MVDTLLQTNKQTLECCFLYICRFNYNNWYNISNMWNGG